MEATPLPTSDIESWADELDQSLNRQRERMQEFLASQQKRLDSAETQLAEQLQTLAEELAKGRSETQQSRQEIEGRSQQIARETEHLESIKQELTDRQGEWKSLQQRAAEQQQMLVEQTKQQQESLQKRFDQLAELEQRDTSRQDDLAEELDEARRRERELSEELEQLRRDQRELPTAGEGGDSEEFGRIEAERDMLRVKLAHAEEQLGAAEAGGGGDGDTDSQRRYEMAMDDLRELKEENANLKQRLKRAPAAPEPSSGGSLDWEAEKRRILAGLEADADESDEEGQTKRIEICDVIKQTDKLLAERDRQLADRDEEIDELKKLLENQSNNLGSVAVGAAALGEMLDNDDVIQEERENLVAMQEQLQDKLRKAEIDISLERAKMARERADLDEKLHIIEQHGDLLDDDSSGSGGSAKPVRGRWLKRLGLKDGEES